MGIFLCRRSKDACGPFGAISSDPRCLDSLTQEIQAVAEVKVKIRRTLSL